MPRPPLAKPKTLTAWATLLVQHQRAWLPLELHGLQNPKQVVLVTVVTGIVVSATLLLHLDLHGVPAWLAGVGVCSALTAWAIRVQLAHHHWKARRGWEADFRQGTLTPVGLANHEAIELTAEHSLGCYVGSGDDALSGYQLELRHARRGPVAALTMVYLPAGNVQDVKLLNECVDLLAQRLNIRRSGAPLLMGKDAPNTH